ncbi:cell division protein FtsX [Bacteroidota bacterium]
MKKRDNGINRRKLRSSYATSIISISLVLFLLGLVGLLLLNAQRLSTHVLENIGFSVVLKEEAKEVDIIRLQKNLDAKAYVKSTDYITKEEAARETSEELGENFIEFLGYNPLPASIVVKFYADYANTDSIASIEKELQRFEEVEEVMYQESLIHLVNENVRKISLIILAFSGVMFFIAIALVNNTIRLSVYAKRFLINTMQLVGATRGFIRKPFLMRSAGHGIYAAIIAILLLVGVIYLIQQEFMEVINFEDVDILGVLFLLVIILGIVLNWISTYFAINKYLRMKSDDLYY